MWRILALVLLAMLAMPAVAKKGIKALGEENPPATINPEPKPKETKHGAQASQLQAKPVLIFNNYGMIFGPSFALEVPIFKNFSLGGIFNAGFDFRSKNSSIFDLALLTKTFFPVQIGKYDASWYFGVPVGFSLGMLKNGSHPGFNFAFLPGFLFYIDGKWGVSAEFGYSCHALQSVTSLHGAQFALGLSHIF